MIILEQIQRHIYEELYNKYNVNTRKDEYYDFFSVLFRTIEPHSVIEISPTYTGCFPIWSHVISEYGIEKASYIGIFQSGIDKALNDAKEINPQYQYKFINGDFVDTNTVEIVSDILQNSLVDVLFIDGVGHYKQTKEVTEMYLKFVRPNGVVGHDDIDSASPYFESIPLEEMSKYGGDYTSVSIAKVMKNIRKNISTRPIKTMLQSGYALWIKPDEKYEYRKDLLAEQERYVKLIESGTYKFRE